MYSDSKDDLRDAKNNFKKAAYGAKRDLRNATDNMGDDLAEAAHDAGRRFRGYIDTANEQFSEAGERVTSEIRNNPLRSSLIALGAGFILGALFRL